MCLTCQDLQTYITAVRDRLNDNRPYLCSEADFQSQFVYEIQRDRDDLIVITDSPYQQNGLLKYIDLRVIDPLSHNQCLIELKYATMTCQSGLLPQLREQNWFSKLRIQFIRDINILEGFVAQHKYAVLLTNEPNYWNAPMNRVYDVNYRLHQFDPLGQQRTISGLLNWGVNPPHQSITALGVPITIQGDYPLIWHYFTQDPLFKYLLLEVN